MRLGQKRSWSAALRSKQPYRMLGGWWMMEAVTATHQTGSKVNVKRRGGQQTRHLCGVQSFPSACQPVSYPRILLLDCITRSRDCVPEGSALCSSVAGWDRLHQASA